MGGREGGKVGWRLSALCCRCMLCVWEEGREGVRCVCKMYCSGWVIKSTVSCVICTFVRCGREGMGREKV